MTKAGTDIDLESALMKMVSKGAEDKIGFKLPTSMSALKDMVVGGGAAKASEFFAPRVAKFAEKAAFASGKNKIQSAKLGRKAENLWRISLPLLPVIWESAKKYKNNVSDYFNVGSSFSTALSTLHNSSSFFTAVNSDLEVVRNERSRISRVITNDSKSTFIHAVSTIPAQIGSQLDKLASAVELDNDEKISNVSNKQWSNAAKDMRRDVANKVNVAFDKALSTIGKDNDEGGREYNKLLKFGIEIFSGIDDLKKMEEPSGRARFIRDIQKTYFGTHISAGTAGIRKYLSAKLDVKSSKQMAQATAAKMIKELEKHLKKNPSPVSLSLSGCSKKECSLEEYIMDIFAQHQKDCGRGEIPKRMQSNLARAAEQIAEAMTDPQRQLHPEALALMVDKKHGIANLEKGEIVKIMHSDELDQYLVGLQRKQKMSMRKGRSAAKQYEKMEATREQVKQSWDNLTPEEKTLWSNFISKEILLDIGVTKSEVEQLQQQDNEYWKETIEEFLSDISNLSGADLKEYGVDESQISQIREAVIGMRKKNAHYLQKNRQEMTELVADVATMVGSHFIKDILGRARKRSDYKDILREKDNEKPIAEQVLASRKDTSENSRH